MPIETLVDHPDFIAMPCAGKGMVFALASHFWMTKCQPLPAADHERRSIARAHFPTWQAHKLKVANVLEAVLPDLERYFHIRNARGMNVLKMARAGGRASVDKAAQYYQLAGVSKSDAEKAAHILRGRRNAGDRAGAPVALSETEAAGGAQFIDTG
jgi:hypothetical protein